MITNPLQSQTNSLADQAANTASKAIASTQRAANHALDSLADGVQDLRRDGVPIINRATEQVSVFAQHGLDAVREGSQHLRDKAQHASDSTVNYIKDEPVKAMLIAAATGAALMALVSLMGRSRDRV